MRRTVIRPLLIAVAMTMAVPAHAQSPAPADPQRLSLATVVVDKVFPVGTYKRLMGGTMNGLMDSMMDATGALPIRQLAAIGGLSPERAAALPEASLAQVMAIYDPHYRERTRLGMRAMMDAMSGTMTRFEPKVRTGLARAYARKFDVAQLKDLDAFFRTPTGAYYAAESMALYMDPELMAEMQSFAPELMKELPAMMKQAEAATASLPKARRIGELTPAERARLAALLGVTPDDLTDPPAPGALPGKEP